MLNKKREKKIGKEDVPTVNEMAGMDKDNNQGQDQLPDSGIEKSKSFFLFRINRTLFLFFLFVLGLGIGYFYDNLIQKIGYQILDKPEEEIIYKDVEEVRRIEIINREVGMPEYLDFSIFWEVWNKIEKEHVGLDRDLRREMLERAIRGVIGATRDEHTEFLNPEEAERFIERMEEKFEGVGMHITIEDGQLKVVAPIKGTPAYNAGILPGDKIIKIDNRATQGMALTYAVSLIRGKVGTEVVLLILRDEKEIEKSITRGVIMVPTTELSFLENGTIAHIKIFNFGAGTFEQMEKIAKEIRNSDAQKIILDLRNNPGGWLTSAVDVAGLFLDRNSIIVIQEKRGREVILRSRSAPLLKDFEIIILVNEGTASGAEILAGALRDHRGVKLVGETTVGKGSVQELKELTDGSMLKITVAYWLTPNRYKIEDEGLTPDIKVINLVEKLILGIDYQLERAIEELKFIK